jgi:hypothetical protein
MVPRYQSEYSILIVSMLPVEPDAAIFSRCPRLCGMLPCRSIRDCALDSVPFIYYGIIMTRTSMQYPGLTCITLPTKLTGKTFRAILPTSLAIVRTTL